MYICHAKISSLQRFKPFLPLAKDEIQLHFSEENQNNSLMQTIWYKTSHVDQPIGHFVVNEQYFDLMAWKCGSVGSNTIETISFETAPMNTSFLYFAASIVVVVYFVRYSLNLRV